MHFVLYGVAALEILLGVLVTLGAKSAVHEILGELGLGFGVLTLAVMIAGDRIVRAVDGIAAQRRPMRPE